MNSISPQPIALATLPRHLNEQINSSVPANAAQPSQPYAPPPLLSEQMDNRPNQYYSPALAPGNPTPPNYSTGSATQVSLGTKDRKPWVYRGYPEMCKWAASDDDFFVLRRFGEVSARVLLRLQDQIVELEERLRDIDKMCLEKGEDNGTFRYDRCEERTWLLDQLTSRLAHYQSFLLDHAQIKARPEATGFQVSNVKDWFHNAREGVIYHEEKKFIDKDGDLISVVPKIKTPLRRFLDKFEKLRLLSPFRATDINERLHKDSHDFGLETTIYNKESVIDKLVTCVTMVIGVAMLVGPLWWLQHLSSHNNTEYRLAVITGFLVLFTILLSILTVARPFEVLAATAAYSAVLMVFMQISN